ncbi:hypothetical protein BT96DRAFT_944710 [Gymnopus androsaceus JB14]|uniref:DNA-directed DNA polymerase n=1 Tax=Gymnopus androsaceus JB14 TaxID=1447944 RepID=A0A6A4H3R4_9AGAR|nr:hypothetical protein BT96DRAFT_944710 [Gymnopus androsaceus JB14]
MGVSQLSVRVNLANVSVGHLNVSMSWRNWSSIVLPAQISSLVLFKLLSNLWIISRLVLKLLQKLMVEISIHKNDPDIIVGHDFLGASLDVLLHCGTNLKFLAGRMLCDLSSDAAKSMITLTTWSLTEMCKSQLKSDREEIDPNDMASYFDGSISNPNQLLTFVCHCELNAHYHMALAAAVQILPLMKQLANLAGNSWNKTLNGVVKTEPVEEDLDAPKDAPKGKGAKKDKYKGGLVLIPRKGLWNSYILVMDFNSLYPSIIQEYNIDFTTVEKSDVEEIDAGEGGQLDLSGDSVPQGFISLFKKEAYQRPIQKSFSRTHRTLDFRKAFLSILSMADHAPPNGPSYESARYFKVHLDYRSTNAVNGFPVHIPSFIEEIRRTLSSTTDQITNLFRGCPFLDILESIDQAHSSNLWRQGSIS